MEHLISFVKPDYKAEPQWKFDKVDSVEIPPTDGLLHCLTYSLIMIPFGSVKLNAQLFSIRLCANSEFVRAR